MARLTGNRAENGRGSALGIVSAIAVGVLEGFHFQGEVLLAKVVALGLVIALVSVSVLRVIAVAEGVFLLEGAAVSVLAPLLFEVSLRFELIGVIMAVGFVAGVGLNRLFGRVEPDDRSTTKAESDAR